MTVDDWRKAAHFGMPFGIGLAVFGVGIALLGFINPSTPIHDLTYLWLMAAVICAFLAGFIGARATHVFTLGVDAGAVACATPLSIIFLIAMFGSGYHDWQIQPAGRYLPGIMNALLVGLFLSFGGAACGAVFGGLVAIPGALLGRVQARLDGAQGFLADRQGALTDRPRDLSDGANPLATSVSGDITIPLSWPKSLLLLVLSCLLAGIDYSAIRSGQNTTLNWIVACMFGLAIPLMAIGLFINHPLLRFSDEGIVYKGGYLLWLRGQACWEDVQAILLEPASERLTMLGLLGHHDLYLILGGKRSRSVRFLSIQMPASTPAVLREAMVRYRRQIEENGVVVSGVE